MNLNFEIGSQNFLFLMPYYKRYSKKRKYGYGSTIRNMKMTRKFKASAANMTQNGRFNISARTTMTFTVNSGTSNTWGYVNVANTVLASDMHKQLSSVFDQYRIDKVSIKFRPAINTANPVSNSVPYVTFFTCVDQIQKIIVYAYQKQEQYWLH